MTKCCKQACHAFGLPTTPIAAGRMISAAIQNAITQQNVAGAYADRIDRPPRSIRSGRH